MALLSLVIHADKFLIEYVAASSVSHSTGSIPEYPSFICPLADLRSYLTELILFFHYVVYVYGSLRRKAATYINRSSVLRKRRRTI